MISQINKEGIDYDANIDSACLPDVPRTKVRCLHTSFIVWRITIVKYKNNTVEVLF